MAEYPSNGESTQNGKSKATISFWRGEHKKYSCSAGQRGKTRLFEVATRCCADFPWKAVGAGLPCIYGIFFPISQLEHLSLGALHSITSPGHFLGRRVMEEVLLWPWATLQALFHHISHYCWMNNVRSLCRASLHFSAKATPSRNHSKDSQNCSQDSYLCQIHDICEQKKQASQS